jgi:DNA repair protein RadC
MKIFKSPLPELTLLYRPTSQKKVKVSTSKEAFFILRPLYDDNTLDYLESSVVVFLNRANNTIGWMKLSQGGMSGTVIDGKIIFAAALNCGASAILLSHNHPAA